MKLFTFAGIDRPNPLEPQNYRLVSGTVLAETPVIASVKVMLVYPNFGPDEMIMYDATVDALAYAALVDVSIIGAEEI